MHNKKKCSKCKIEKDFVDFHKCSRSKDGKKSACKKCRNTCEKVYAKNKREQYRDIINKKQKEWVNKKLKENKNYYKEQYFKYYDSSIKSSRKYYKKHREKCIERMRKWRENNKKAVLESMRKWREENLEAYKASHKKWLKDNKDHVRCYNHMKRALIREVTIQKFSAKELDERMSVFGYRCAYCGGKFEHVDHVKAISKGGPHCLANLRPSCKDCNLKKYNKDLKTWLKDRINK